MRLVKSTLPLDELLVTVRQNLPVRSLFTERRHARELSKLCEKETALFFRSDGSLSVAITKVVANFVEKGVLACGPLVLNRLLVEENGHPRQLVECRDTHCHTVLPLSVVFGEIEGLEQRLVGVVWLHENSAALAVVLTPPNLKTTKTAQELAATLASFLSYSEVRHELSQAESFYDFSNIVESFCNVSLLLPHTTGVLHELECEKIPCLGIWRDLKRRAPWYLSDYVDGFVGPKHLQKVISTTVFLFCIVLLPSLALGESFSTGTNGTIAIQQVIWMQLVAGCSFALFGGQPLVIIMTTAPFALFTRVLFGISLSLGVPFLSLYAWTGVFCAIYSTLAAVFNLSFLIRYFTLFTEETFALFIAASFLFVSIVACLNYFSVAYFIKSKQASAILFLFLMLFSVWLMVKIYNLRKTAFLTARLREIISDFSLPIGVVFSSFFGSYVFQNIELPRFVYIPSGRVFVLTNMADLPIWAIFASMGFGLILALLFLIDHSISSAMAQTPAMKTQKGSAYHWDLLLTSGLCVVSSVFGMPWVNASVPHGPLHTIALADVEEVNQDGTVR